MVSVISCPTGNSHWSFVLTTALIGAVALMTSDAASGSASAVVSVTTGVASGVTVATRVGNVSLGFTTTTVEVAF